MVQLWSDDESLRQVGKIIHAPGSFMELISLKDTIDFLSASAPRAWLKRMVLWMVFQGELDVFVRFGRVTPRTSRLQFYIQTFGNLPNDQDHEQLLRSKCEPELANKLLSPTPPDYIDDTAIEWNDEEDAHQIGPGYLISTEAAIVWKSSSVTGTLSHTEINDDRLFWDADYHCVTDFEEPDFVYSFGGLCFPRKKVELLQPDVDLATERRVPIEARVRPGRPRVWNWDGALLHLLNIAQQPDGLPVGPGAQAYVERLISEWFIEKVGNAPSSSQVRTHAAEVMRAIGKPESR